MDMDLVTGNLYWINKNRIYNKYTYLSEDIKCDVVIIGGGITGALCAYYFSKENMDVVLVDKNIIGYGSTSASTSLLQYEIDTNLIGLRGMMGIDNAVKCFHLCQKSIDDIYKIVKEMDDPCDFRRRDCLYYTHNNADVSILEKEFRLRKEHGFDAAYITSNNSKEKFSFPIKGGIYTKNGAAQIDPYAFTQELIASSVSNGLKVFENTEVVDIHPNTDGVTLTTKNRFKIQGKKVIIATGFEAKKYIKERILFLTRTFTIVTKPVKDFRGWHNKCIIRDTNTPYTYIRPTGDHRIIIGGEDLDIGGAHSKISKLSNGDMLSVEKYRVLHGRLKSLFPDIKDVEVDYSFSGLFGETKDSLPYIGEYEGMPNCYFCLGYGSNGILYGVLGAKLLKELFFGKYLDELNLFKFNR